MSLLNMSYMAAVLIAITILLRALLLHKLPKQGFMALWYISIARLLIPFSIPSAMSVYTVAQNIAQAGGGATAVDGTFSESFMVASGGFPPQTYSISGTPDNLVMTPMPLGLPPEIFIWFIGAAALALFFIITHLRWRKKYKASLPVENDFVTRWQADHPLRRKVDIRHSNSISAPLTYGIFRPVVLLPNTTDYADTPKLSYILSHEYAHIRRFDAFIKPLLAVALCLHWFNPLVWVMYILANRDMELLCDEHAVREYGLESKSSYALTLIGMEEAKGADPLCNCFNKSAIKERITAIMKIKKMPIIAIIIATIIILSVTVAFATSGKAETPDTKPVVDSASNSIFASLSKEEQDIMRSLMPEGYEEMSVTEYRNKILPIVEGATAKELIAKLRSNPWLWYFAEESDYLDYVLFPLIEANWKNIEIFEGTQSYGDAAVAFSATQTITNADKLTVGNYAIVIESVFDALSKMLTYKTEAELEDKVAIVPIIESEMKRLENEYSNDSLTIQLNLLGYDYQLGAQREDSGDGFLILPPNNAEASFYSEEAVEQRIKDGAKAAAAATSADEMLSTEAGRTAKLLTPYLSLGLEYDEKALESGKLSMTYKGKEVRSLYDYGTGVFLSNGLNPNDYSKDAVDLYVLYNYDGGPSQRIELVPSSMINATGYADMLNRNNVSIKPSSSESDFRSLLELQTSDYKNISVAEFNARLQKWADSDSERSTRVMSDISALAFPMELTEPEQYFLTRTVMYSNWENGVARYGEANTPRINGYILESSTAKDGGSEFSGLVGCNLQYRYDIKDATKLDVLTRDYNIEYFLKNVQEYWDNNIDFSLLTDKVKADEFKPVFDSELIKITSKCSDSNMSIAIISI